MVGGVVTGPQAVAYSGIFGTVTVPPLRRFPTTLVTVPFTVNGDFSTGSWGRANAITGQGFASVLFQSEAFDEHSSGWTADQVQYDFSQSTPVPEPATLGTLAFGLAALARTATQEARPSIRGNANCGTSGSVTAVASRQEFSQRQFSGVQDGSSARLRLTDCRFEARTSLPPCCLFVARPIRQGL